MFMKNVLLDINRPCVLFTFVKKTHRQTDNTFSEDKCTEITFSFSLDQTLNDFKKKKKKTKFSKY